LVSNIIGNFTFFVILELGIPEIEVKYLLKE